MAAGRHLEKVKSPYVSRCLRYLHQIWCAGSYGQSAVCSDVILGLKQNPRWRRPPFWIMENRNNSAAVWTIVTKFGVMVDMDSLQRAVTTIFDLYKNPKCRPAAILKKGKSPYLSRCFRYLHQIWCAVGHWHPAPSPCVIFGLQQNPRWRPAPFWKSGKSQNLDSRLRCLHKFFSKTANIIYKNCKQFI